MNINTVKMRRDGGYLVNGSLSVPDDSENRHYQSVQQWITGGGVVDPIETLIEAKKRRITEIKTNAIAFEAEL